VIIKINGRLEPVSEGSTAAATHPKILPLARSGRREVVVEARKKPARKLAGQSG
jgi:hypothetical protein